MIKKEDIEKLKGQRFYSEKLKRFIVADDEIDTIIKSLNKAEEPAVAVQKIYESLKEIEDLISDSKTKHRLEKRKSFAFWKDIFLLGRNRDMKFMWLEAPKWDCGWYWGFGYVETYTNNNNPERSKDIDSHSHFSGLIGDQEYYDSEKQCWRKGEYIHNVYDSPVFIETTFSSKEGWQLSELFKQFYLLAEMAEFCHKEKPGCHVTESPVDHGDMKDWYEHINKVMIPKITDAVLKILSPEEVKNEQ